MQRPAKRARVAEQQSGASANEEEDRNHENRLHEQDHSDGDDNNDHEGDTGGAPDSEPQPRTDGDDATEALVHALAGTDHGGGGPDGEQHEDIVDYCYRMGYFPANEPFPSAVNANRFRAAPLRPQRTLERNPLTRRSWHPKKPANWCAVLLQCGGQEVSDACTRCVDGQGFWAKCVVPNDWATSWITRGACANCYMDGRRANCSRGFGMAVSPSARAKAAAGAQAAATPASEPDGSTAVRNTTAAPYTSAGFAPPVGATANTAGQSVRPSVPAEQAQPQPDTLSSSDFESLKRQYNRMSTSDLDKLAEQSAAERARISLQLAAIDAVRAAREAFANHQSNGRDPV